MVDEFKIISLDEPAWDVIGEGISSFNKQQAGEDNFQNLCFVLQGTDEKIVGGVIGNTYWDWLYINLMWISEEFRGQGHGRRLLETAEDEARKRGAKNAFLNTFSFQARKFYEKYDYRVFGELNDFPVGHKHYFLTKEL